MDAPSPADQPEPWPIAQRLEEFFRRLAAAPGPTNAEEAFDLLARILDEVEDRYSGVEKRANPGLSFDGRMYPPQDDHIERFADGSLVARTRGHLIEIDPAGGITIRLKRTGETVFQKAGGGVP